MGRVKAPQGYSIACWPKPQPISAKPRDVGDPDGRCEISPRDELIEIAGLDAEPESAETMLREIASVLGEHPHAVRVIDGASRPASIALALQAVIDAAEALMSAMPVPAQRTAAAERPLTPLPQAAHAFYRALASLDHASKKTLYGASIDRKQLMDAALRFWVAAQTTEGTSPPLDDGFAAAVLAFRDFLSEVRDRLTSQESRGRPRRKAVAYGVTELRDVFTRNERIDRSIFETSSSSDEAEPEPRLHPHRLAADFVATAFDAGGIKRPQGAQAMGEDRRRYELEDLLRHRRR